MTASEPLAPWQVLSARITGFLISPAVAPIIDWWERFVHAPPDSVASQYKIGRQEATGEFEGRRLVLQIKPERIDWAFPAVVDGQEDVSDASPLGTFPEVMSSLLRVVVPWASESPPLNRLALGAVLAEPVKDRREGYVLIAKYLPTVTLDPTTSDFLYQINRPRHSGTGVANLQINRLSKWSVQVVQRIALTSVSGSVAARALNEEYSCRLELDINTAATFDNELPRDRILALIEELVGLSREIADKGDIP